MNGSIDSRLPIGVFDSGLGGLTVVKQIRRKFPDETIVYLGDNARVPYGTRSNGTIERYARNCSRFLLDQGLKMLVVACNTVSAVAIPAIREMTKIPVLGVIEAGADAVAFAGARRVGVIGTAGTIRSNAYPKKIKKRLPECNVFQRATPLLVPLAEEGWIEGEVPELVTVHYLEELATENIDVLLLGCTHYPLLVKTIKKTLHKLGSNAQVVDSATAMAASVGQILFERQLNAQHKKNRPAKLTCHVTDRPESFEVVAARFLGEMPGFVHQIDIA